MRRAPASPQPLAMRCMLACASGLPLACSLLAQAPADGEVRLPAANGWRAHLIQQCDKGVWYAHVAKFIDAYAANEVIAADDLGRLLVLSVYSGKWTAHAVNPDGQWLAPSQPADVDPRIPGPEVYAAGKAGNIHRIWLEPRPGAKFEVRSVEIGHAAGEEFHTVVAADLDPMKPGDELWAFAISGALYALAAEGNAGFAMRQVASLPGRVRDAVVLPGRQDDPVPRVFGVSRSGHLLCLRSGDPVRVMVIAQETSGLGRITRRPRSDERASEVLYATRDDGVLLRFAEDANGTWAREVIFLGSQGLRGAAAGRFHADTSRETVAVFGYGKRVQIIGRAPGAWEVEEIFADHDPGHWLAAGELDGRNATDELVATGFGGKVVLLSRPPGYGLSGAAVYDDAPRTPMQHHAGERELTAPQAGAKPR